MIPDHRTRTQIGISIPHIFCYGFRHENNAMVKEFLQSSLEHVFSYWKRRVPLRTDLILADWLLSRLQHI